MCNNQMLYETKIDISPEQSAIEALVRTNTHPKEYICSGEMALLLNDRWKRGFLFGLPNNVCTVSNDILSQGKIASFLPEAAIYASSIIDFNMKKGKDRAFEAHSVTTQSFETVVKFHGHVKDGKKVRFPTALTYSIVSTSSDKFAKTEKFKHWFWAWENIPDALNISYICPLFKNIQCSVKNKEIAIWFDGNDTSVHDITQYLYFVYKRAKEKFGLSGETQSKEGYNMTYKSQSTVTYNISFYLVTN